VAGCGEPLEKGRTIVPPGDRQDEQHFRVMFAQKEQQRRAESHFGRLGAVFGAAAEDCELSRRLQFI
jgi:hypothetical protein